VADSDAGVARSTSSVGTSVDGQSERATQGARRFAPTSFVGTSVDGQCALSV